jgi:hypothetical protein
MAAIAPTTQPSFYYMLIARTCVARSRRAAPARSQALREAANHYRAKAWPDRSETARRGPETRR